MSFSAIKFLFISCKIYNTLLKSACRLAYSHQDISIWYIFSDNLIILVKLYDKVQSALFVEQSRRISKT